MGILDFIFNASSYWFIFILKTYFATSLKRFSVYNTLHSLMFTIYKTRIIFYLWYIAKNHR